MYDYITTGNGNTLTIICRVKSIDTNQTAIIDIAFLQNDDASKVLEQLENATTDEQVQNILSVYDY